MVTLWLALIQSAVLGGSSPANRQVPDRPTPSPSAHTVAVQTGAAPRDSVYAGRAHQLDIAVPRLADPSADRVVVDGVLDESAWQRASVLTSFTTYNPVDGRAAQDSIHVRVFYGAEALFVAYRAWAPAGTVRATLAERDKIQNDDWIALHLDTFNDQRRSMVFIVNPLGVQSDGLRLEQSPGPGVSKASLQAIDLSQDYVWQSAGRRLDDGYTVELRIPFKSLRYQLAAQQDWGIQIIRQTQRTGYQDTWAPASRANQSLSAQEGHLRGLHDLQRGLVLDLTPTSVTTTTGLPQPQASGDSRWRYSTRHEASGDLRWGITPNLTVSGTVNPDFSQVETDVGQIPGDVRFANFYPELRPFFVEGSDQFEVPNKLVNTRNIVQPVGAVKLTGKIPRTDVGLLSAVDAATASGEHPIFNVLRLRRDIGEQSNAGLVITDRTQGTRYNRLAGFDTRLQWANYYSAEVRLAGSLTHDSSGTRRGALWEVTQGRSGRAYGNRYALQGFSPDFRTDVGFINRVNFVKAQVNQRLTVFGERGGWWDQRQHFFTGSTLWNYAEFGRTTPLETKLSIDNSLQIRGGWKVSVTPDLQVITFDPRRYASLFTKAASGSGYVAFVPGGMQTTSSTVITVNTPQWRRIGATIAATVGTEPEFFEASHVHRRDLEATIDVRPTAQVRVGALLRYQRFVRDRDGTQFSAQAVPRLRLEYQLSRALFVRFVGQFESRERSALRDPRTEQPLYLRSSAGAYTLQANTKAMRGRVDWLVSYLPSPGTVIFFGYGTALDASATMRPGEPERTSDGAFLKVSYLFRVQGQS
ncbi:MAG: DUF5916 domain-containing protein [Gemmatimonadaceae bacterium]